MDRMREKAIRVMTLSFLIVFLVGAVALVFVPETPTAVALLQPPSS